MLFPITVANSPPRRFDTSFSDMPSASPSCLHERLRFQPGYLPQCYPPPAPPPPVPNPGPDARIRCCSRFTGPSPRREHNAAHARRGWRAMPSRDGPPPCVRRPPLLVVHEPPLSTHLLHLAHRVNERDPPFEPARLADPGKEGGMPVRTHRPGDPRVRVFVAPAHPDPVLAVALGHRARPPVAPRFDSVAKDLPDRPCPPASASNHSSSRRASSPAIPPSIAYVAPRDASVRSTSTGRRFLERWPIFAFAPRPHPPRVLEHVARLGDPRPRAPEALPAHLAA